MNTYTNSKNELTRSWTYKRMHHEIIDNNEHNPQIQQTSLAEFHRLNVTLSNYIEVAPTIVNGITLSATPKTKTVPTEAESIITV